MVAILARSTPQMEPKNTIVQIGNTNVGLLIDSGSVCSILKKSLAREIINNSTLALCLTATPAKGLTTIPNEPIPVIGMMQTLVAFNGWRMEDAEFIVVRNGLQPLNARDLFDALGVSATQTLNPIECSMVNNITTHCQFQLRKEKQFPNNFTNWTF